MSQMKNTLRAMMKMQNMMITIKIIMARNKNNKRNKIRKKNSLKNMSNKERTIKMIATIIYHNHKNRSKTLI